MHLFLIPSTSFPGPCCDDLDLETDGFAEDYQGDRLGRYYKISQTNDGRAVYQQTGGANFLFWLADQRVWMVGEEIGRDFGGILNRENGACPENLSMDWEYWSDWQEVVDRLICVFPSGVGISRKI